MTRSPAWLKEVPDDSLQEIPSEDDNNVIPFPGNSKKHERRVGMEYERIKEFAANGVEVIIEYNRESVTVTKINEPAEADFIPIKSLVYEVGSLSEAKRMARNFEALLYLLTSEIVTRCTSMKS